MSAIASSAPSELRTPPGRGAWSDEVRDAYEVAGAAIDDMHRHDVAPTVAAYELWLAFRSDAKPALTRRISEMLSRGETLTPGKIDALRDEFELGAPPSEEADNYLDLTHGLQDAAHALFQNAASGRAAIRDYGEVLALSLVHFGERPAGDDGFRLIAMLTSETLKMAERNRGLREQLSTTSAKVEKLRRLLADEKQAASTDQLTGLANRRAFSARVKRTLAKVAGDDPMCASLLLLDIDDFKRFNDSYGHSTGDLVLRLVGRLLIESIKGRDLAARYGGEEFGVLLIGADLDAAAKVARQVGASLANKRFKVSSATEQGQATVTVSIGVAQLHASDTIASVIDRADLALYAAKHAGRNRVITEAEIAAGAARSTSPGQTQSR